MPKTRKYHKRPKNVTILAWRAWRQYSKDNGLNFTEIKSTAVFLEAFRQGWDTHKRLG